VQGLVKNIQDHSANFFTVFSADQTVGNHLLVSQSGIHILSSSLVDEILAFQ